MPYRGSSRVTRPLTVLLVSVTALCLDAGAAVGNHAAPRSRRPQPVPPHTEVADPEPVRLVWSEVAAGGGLAELASGTLTLMVTSELPYEADVRVGVGVIDGSRSLA